MGKFVVLAVIAIGIGFSVMTFKRITDRRSASPEAATVDQVDKVADLPEKEFKRRSTWIPEKVEVGGVASLNGHWTLYTVDGEPLEIGDFLDDIGQLVSVGIKGARIRDETGKVRLIRFRFRRFEAVQEMVSSSSQFDLLPENNLK